MRENKTTKLDIVTLEGESFLKITNIDVLRPFFMSIVSESNHWMFISSNGGLTAGRKNAEYALFPYYTDDKITEAADITGSRSIFQITKGGYSHIWEPFSHRYEGKYQITRNLYKNVYGNKVVFEEINQDLGLTFRYQWNSSNTYGFIKKSTLVNSSDEEIAITVLDGLQNILPYGVESDLQRAASNLVDAYKRSELDKTSGLGIFALSAIIVDRAEPSEALKANIAWSLGLEDPTYLLSSKQLADFRAGHAVTQETDVKAEKGAYFVLAQLSLPAQSQKEWMIIADVNKNHADVAKMIHRIQIDSQLYEKINEKINLGTDRLIALNASADGLQYTADTYRDTRHFANTLFNLMRGGVFDHNYQIERWDFKNYLQKANSNVADDLSDLLETLPETFASSELKKLAVSSKNADFRRLCLEYMPLKFSRRHGDPSRPWNKFSINTKSEIDGSKILDYEGNWRDIFQNWEALAFSFPEFIESMICKFLNASTFDGYNPYRVTKDGYDWETIEPDDPWSYIGYWGDHQIIYLLKFLEFSEQLYPGRLASLFQEDIFVYANVPYKIKTYADLLKNPKDTIIFDEKADHNIRQDRDQIGADGALLKDQNNDIVKVNFIEKILATTLAKLSNFIPEGGIWMNTQRPEWNDANNALVGNGVSMVTLYYLRRFLNFFEDIFATVEMDSVTISVELHDLFGAIHDTLQEHKSLLSESFNDRQRKDVLDSLGNAASDYRNKIYTSSFSGKKVSLALNDLKRFTQVTLAFLEHSIKANKRTDNLYHAYNLMTVENENEISISHLDEMLEGQVAVLSAKYLSPSECLDVLDAMKNSRLFREDQYSYVLYPNKNLKGFMARNTIPEASILSSKLLSELVAQDNKEIVEKDINGIYHFNGNFRNANDLKAGLDGLSARYQDLRDNEEATILNIYEDVFNHKAFTGRSGTFYGYEGLGSIYWHMVSKLQLAVQECALSAIEQKESPELIGKLLEHYYEINAGIGVHKPVSLYGAFPTDPYSHTPAGKGAQQPGMTGQVKEDIISRFGELGVFIDKGTLVFNPCLLRKNEFLAEPSSFEYITVNQSKVTIDLMPNSLVFTICQVPVIYTLSDRNEITIHYSDGEAKTTSSLQLSRELSQEIFGRTGKVSKLVVHITEDQLK